MRDRRKRKRKATAKPEPVVQPTLTEIVAKVTAAFAEIAPNAISRLTEYELRAKYAEERLKFLHDKLVGLLSPDQIEAARISGCPPEVYAIEWIEIWREQIFPKSGAMGVMTLSRLQR